MREISLYDWLCNDSFMWIMIYWYGSAGSLGLTYWTNSCHCTPIHAKNFRYWIFYSQMIFVKIFILLVHGLLNWIEQELKTSKNVTVRLSSINREEIKMALPSVVYFSKSFFELYIILW